MGVAGVGVRVFVGVKEGARVNVGARVLVGVKVNVGVAVGVLDGVGVRKRSPIRFGMLHPRIRRAMPIEKQARKTWVKPWEDGSRLIT